LQISTLGSGSKGNATVLKLGSTTLLVDCGFGLKDTLARMASIDVSPADLNAILVTHEHADHISGVESLAAKFSIPVFMTQGTARVWKSRGRVQANIIHTEKTFHVNDVEVVPVAVPHDAKEPVQFVITYLGYSIGILTDLGMLTPSIFESYKVCRTLLIEANHDLEMLHGGPYPFSLKKRVAGNWGHLNNLQTVEFLNQLDKEGVLDKVIIAHVSEKNNSQEAVGRALEGCTIDPESIIRAVQSEPMKWLGLK